MHLSPSSNIPARLAASGLLAMICLLFSCMQHAQAEDALKVGVAKMSALEMDQAYAVALSYLPLAAERERLAEFRQRDPFFSEFFILTYKGSDLPTEFFQRIATNYPDICSLRGWYALPGIKDQYCMRMLDGHRCRCDWLDIEAFHQENATSARLSVFHLNTSEDFELRLVDGKWTVFFPEKSPESTTRKRLPRQGNVVQVQNGAK